MFIFGANRSAYFRDENTITLLVNFYPSLTAFKILTVHCISNNDIIEKVVKNIIYKKITYKKYTMHVDLTQNLFTVYLDA